MGGHPQNQSNYWGNGYATEAACACRRYAFSHLDFDTIYSYMNMDNLPSRRVAERNHMKMIKNYFDERQGETIVVYAAVRSDSSDNADG
jgi:RimJ/RimL family protein N-acetyltransferase